MHSSPFSTPGLTLALAIAAGLAGQSLARRLGIPALIVLLALGVLLGPDAANVIRPSSIGVALPVLIAFSVAVILFEGGLGLDLRRLRREGRAIRQLATVGAVVSALAGTAVAHAVMGWPWRLAMLFGTLAMVTGPTVINPMLERLRVESTTATILAAEGVLVDALGAISATVALEVAIETSSDRFVLGLGQILLRLGFGALMGAGIGWLLGRLLQTRNVVPEGLENVVTLSAVLLLYQASNAIEPESGIPAVIVAGAVVGSVQTHISRQLVEFKEQLTTMFIGMLFVLLAADVRLGAIADLGARGLGAVVLLMLVVRPLSVLVGTAGTGLTWRRQAFLAWIGPRGIVAAAVASFFAGRLEAHGVAGGRPLQALVFLLIAVSVVTVGTTGGLVGRWLGLRRNRDDGWVLLGANELAVELGRLLRAAGHTVVCIDRNPSACRAAEEAGLRALHGDALRELTLARAELDTRRGVLALVPNDELDLLFLRRAKQIARELQAAAALGATESGATAELLGASSAALLFARATDVESWSVRLRHETARREVRRYADTAEPRRADDLLGDAPPRLFVALTRRRDGRVDPLFDTTLLEPGDEIDLLLDEARATETEAWLEDNGLSAGASREPVVRSRPGAPETTAPAKTLVQGA